MGAERNAVREQGEPSERVKQLDNDAAVMFRSDVITGIPPKVNSKVYSQLNSNQIHTKKTLFHLSKVKGQNASVRLDHSHGLMNARKMGTDERQLWNKA